MNEKLESGLSARSVQYHHAVLRTALEQAARWDLVPRNVAKLVSPPRVRRDEVMPLSVVEARHFLKSVEGDRLAALYALTFALGLRQSEALGLTWESIDVETGSVAIKQTLQRHNGAYHLEDTKTARSTRTVAVPDEITPMLRIHKAHQLEERLRAGPQWEGDQWNLVFATETGGPLYGSWMTKRFQRQLEAAGLPRQRWHDMRHAAATFMLALGVPMRAVMDVLGHSQIHVTADTYSHVMPELQRDAVGRVGKALWS